MPDMQPVTQLFFQCIDNLDPEQLEELKEASRANLEKPMDFYITDPAVTDAISKHPAIWFLCGGIYAAFLDDSDSPADPLSLPDVLGQLTRNGNTQAQQDLSNILRVMFQKNHDVNNIRVALVPAVQLAYAEGFVVDFPRLLADLLEGEDDPDALKEKWNAQFAADQQ